MPDRQLLQLDIEAILKKRIPSSKQKFIPGFLYTALSRLIHQDELNEILRISYPSQGSEFSQKVLNHLDIEVEVDGAENLPSPDHRVVFASNHPLGGLDGIALIAVLGERYGDENISFLVNDLLMNVEPLSNVFLPINKYGSQARAAAEAINAAYASDRQIVIFPAGLVSRLHPGGEIHDLKWQKAFVQKAIENDRDIVPVRFIALNRKRFYRLSKWRKKLGIKVNIEQATLPAELCASRGKRFRIIIGQPISVSELKQSGKSFPQLAEEIRSHVYTLHQPEKI
ncbi:MAG: 1-acyl-sn-glycerol-3-phosphate acyltransferase [Muribaculaceae bacterium]|nr:1-acyl-sn-glycerol-3-phosphate acyltransferase [Muribaculaceae bacterium]MDE6552872.1 1-acyl-sn-glycerol-3-phosphate acyltransferase [Muribaculaceae bacterium]